MRSFVIALVLASGFATRVIAQVPTSTLRIEVQSAGKPVPDTAIVVDGVSHRTDPQGVLVLTVPLGAVEVTAVKAGFSPVTTSLQVASGEHRVLIELTGQQTLEEEVTVIATTRTERRIEDQPMRVEVLPREEIEEKMMMTPGDIVMMLNEMGGLRVQATSPSLGAASIRIQGMQGRYTRFLSDGLPLFGEQGGGLSLLQIPPMDLGQVEVIKGVASALYGAGAMGGVVNLISRRPNKESVHEILVNRSTRGATDTVLWLSRPLSDSWGFTLLGGGHWQNQTDVSQDGWADLAGYARGIARPRVFWDGKNGRSFFATAGITWEDRTGGTEPGSVLPATGTPYTEGLETRRFDVGALAQALVHGRYVVTARGAVARQAHDHTFGEIEERDRHETGFGEVAIRGSAPHQTWVAGAAIEHDRYRPRDVPRFAYSYTIPGVFVQDDLDIRKWLSISGSGRLDVHNIFGTFFSPRFSVLARPGRWTSRFSIGRGFFAPTPLTEETEAAGLSRLSIPDPLKAERGQSGSIDLSRTDGAISYTVTLFRSRVRNPVDVNRDDVYVLRNLPEPSTNTGVELLSTFRRAPFTVTGTYSFVHSRQVGNQDVPLTPRHSAGIVAMAENETKGRGGVEVYFTGRQRLESNPYRDVSEPYVLFGFLAERRLGRLRLFINAENLSGVRQTRWDPILLHTRAADGRWTVDAWAPLDGRVINGGIRLGF